MATLKPRITITLEPEQHEVLKRLSALQKQPMAAIVKDLMHEVTPVLSTMADALEVALRSGHQVRAQIRKSVEEAGEEIMPIAEAMRSQLDLFVGMIEEAAAEAASDAAVDGAASARPSSAADAADDPRPVITGVRNLRGVQVTATHQGASPRAK